MKPETNLEFDVLVCGGGPSGIAAAVNAARLGAQTLLVERYGRLGGAGVVNMVNPLMGDVHSPFADEVNAHFSATNYDWETLDLVYADLLDESGAQIWLHTWTIGPLMDGEKVVGARVLNKSGETAIRAKVVVDATADGDIAFGAGAAFEKGREGDGLLQPMTIMYRLGGVDKSRGLLCGCEEEAHERFIGGRSWHEITLAGTENGELPANVGIIRLYESARPGERIVNATQINYVDGTSVQDLTRAEFEGRRQAVKVTNFLKKHASGYENSYIAQMPASVGVRETRRFIGREYLTAADIMAGRKWPDAVVKSAFFPVDIHNPDGAGQAQGFAALPQPYDIPLGCLLPQKTDGLVLSGRCISGSHEAHASYRVQRIVMAIGAASGAVAALSAAQNGAPHQVEAREVQRVLGLDWK